MINRNWENFGDQIIRTVQNAVDSRNYSELNRTITRTLNQAVNGMHIFGGTNNGFNGYRQNDGFDFNNSYQQGNPGHQANEFESKWNWNSQNNSFGQDNNFAGQNGGYGFEWEKGYYGDGYSSKYNIVRNRNNNIPPSPYYASTASTKAGGIMMTIIGFMATSSFLSYAASIATYIFAADSPELMNIILAPTYGVLAIISCIIGILGISKLRRVGRFKRYRTIIEEREYCDIKELSSICNKSPKYIIKDVEHMIRKGMFRQGHLDKQKTCLIVTDKAYDQYLQTSEQYERRKQEEDQGTQKKSHTNDKRENLSEDVLKVINAGDQYIKKIHESNDAIPGEEISAKISKMEMLIKRIFERVEQDPETVTDIRRLMDYYLPTTVKLLEAYEDLDAQPVQGENIISSKKEIEKTLDTLNFAFEKLLDDLFHDTAWDVSSDISALHTILAQEGLTGKNFKKE